MANTAFKNAAIPVYRKSRETTSSTETSMSEVEIGKFNAVTQNYIESVRYASYEATLVIKGNFGVKVADKIGLQIFCKDGSIHFASGTYLVIGKVDQIEGDFTSTLKLQKYDGALEPGIMNIYARSDPGGGVYGRFGGSGNNNLSYSQIQARYMPGGTQVPGIHDSGLGAEIAKFAYSFIGKIPYVSGGESLTTGADCSGFVWAVYDHFGIHFGRSTANSYRNLGVAVSEADIQAGDIVCYDGHVNIYVGEGKCVAARGRDGIPLDKQIGMQNLHYKTIRAIRRLV